MPSGRAVERMGSSGGFLLGIAFDRAGNCFACDLKHAAIFRYDAKTRRMERFAASGIRVPNYPVVDEERGCLYVSDSSGDPGPGIFRFDLRTGEGAIWSAGPTRFANGMAMAPDRKGLYLVESHVPGVSYVPIEPDGSAGAIRSIVSDVQNVPDGLAFAADGTLYISCYEPSRIYRLKPGGTLELLIEDRKATIHRPPDQHRPQGQQDVHGEPRPLAHHGDRFERHCRDGHWRSRGEKQTHLPIRYLNPCSPSDKCMRLSYNAGRSNGHDCFERACQLRGARYSRSCERANAYQPQ